MTSAAEIPQIVSAIDYAHSPRGHGRGRRGQRQTNELAYPARAPGVISVGATTKDRCLADYSNGGARPRSGGAGRRQRRIDARRTPTAARTASLPSIYQLTLIDPPHWGRFGYPSYYVGTSMSAPEVAATAALVIASGVIGPHPSPDAILARLEETAVPLGPIKPSLQFGYGMLDAGAATTPGPPPPSPLG